MLYKSLAFHMFKGETMLFYVKRLFWVCILLGSFVVTGTSTAQDNCGILYGRSLRISSSGRGFGSCSFRGRLGDEIHATCLGCDEFSLNNENSKLLIDSSSKSLFGPYEITFKLPNTGNYFFNYIYDFGSHQEPTTDFNGNTFYQNIEDPGSLTITLELVPNQDGRMRSDVTGVSLSDLANKVLPDEIYENEGFVIQESSKQLRNARDVVSGLYNSGYNVVVTEYERTANASSMIGLYTKLWVTQDDSCALRSIRLSLNLFNDLSGPTHFINDQDLRQAYIDEGYYSEISIKDDVFHGYRTFNHNVCGVLASRIVQVAQEEYIVSITVSYDPKSLTERDIESIISAKISDVIKWLQ